MRRSLIAALAAMAALMLTAAVVIAVSSESSRQDVRYQSTGMMHGSGAGPDWHQGRVEGHGPGVASELDYLTHMIAHHREAVSAARELQRSDRPEMRDFGASVVATQSAQIVQMRAWLARWYPNRSLDVGYRPMMRDLSRLSADRLDRAFLTDMVPHHMMAVMMSQRLLVRGLADHPQVNALARSIRDEQHAEILRMQGWLADWFGDSWHHGWGAGRHDSPGGGGPGMMW